MSIGENKVVSMFYELKDADGNVLDSNIGEKALSFIMGKNQIIPGLENEISKLNEGSKANVVIKAEEAYGVYDEKAIQVLPVEQFAGLELTKGMTLYGQGEDGNTVQVVVKEFNDKDVTIDFNHPLAGKELHFDVELSEVRDATDDELISGSVAGAGCGCGHEHGHSHGEDGGCCGGGGHGHSHGGGGCGCGH
ncbi:MAG: peptidylprolyl isomerase [Campylobacteraceae bacterium]